MKREIKFRVFTGIGMEYDVVAGRLGSFYVSAGENKKGLDDSDKSSLNKNNTIYPESTHLMQFTGLKDINGKEIYEGDIIENTVYNPTTGIKEKSIYVCSYERNYFLYNSIGTNEIIGNIFENKELLTDTISYGERDE
jgi:uncharacterized phage protein (TIGR01671 family)